MATSTSNTAAAQKAIDEQNVYIRDTLMSVASNYASVLRDAVENAFDSAEASTLAVVGKDLTKTFNKLAKMSDEFAHNQSRIAAGVTKQKDIAKQLQSLSEKREELEVKLSHAKRLGAEFSQEDLAAAQKSLDIQEEQLKKDEKQLELIERRLGLTGKLVQGLNKVPFIGKFFNTEEIETKMRKVAASGGGTFKTMGVAAGEIGKQLGKGLTDPLTLLTFFLNQALKANKQVVELGKQLGKDSYTYRENLAAAARFNSNINITTENLIGAFSELAKETGFAYEFTVDQLATQVKLTKQVGLQADEAAQIQKLGVLNNKTSEQTYNSFVKGLVATRNQLKVGIDFKATLAEATKVSGQLAANLGYNPERIAKAVVTAKAFGMTLEQVAKSGESLLNFESSLESELKAELLTGKQLNLERARAAALAGDQIALAEELAKNVGTAADFTKMNVLQQKSLAEAVGMTSDELANTLVKREQALASGKSLAQITEEEAKTALERQAVQEKFNQAILKLQDFFGNLIAGPFGTFLDMLTTSLGLITSIGAGLATWYVTSKLIAGSQLLIAWYSKQKLIADRMGVGVGNVIIGQLGRMLGISTAKAVAETTAATAISFGTLLPVILGAGAAIYGLISSFKGDDVLSEGGYGKRTLLSPEGAIKLNDKDTVIAGTDLGGGGGGGSMPSIDLTPMVAAINEVKAAVKELMNRPVIINMDSKQVGTSLVQNASYKSA
jgi:hypothetical protein